MKNPDFEAYQQKQDGIYDNMRAVNAQVGATEGLERDPGTEPQSAFLVAWRHPEHITEQAEELSLAIGGLYKTVPYGRENAHTTLSDYGLRPNAIITPDDPDHAAVLEALALAVRNGIDATDKGVLASRGVNFGDMFTNKKTVVAAGQATESNWKIAEAIKSASAKLGIGDGAGLKGSWGNHMTISRFLEDRPVDEARAVADMLAETPFFGNSIPSAIDVGYFHTDPEKGFVYTTAERFDLPK